MGAFSSHLARCPNGCLLRLGQKSRTSGLKPKTVELKPEISELKPKKLTAVQAPISLDVQTAVPALCFRDMTSERTQRAKPKTLELKPKTSKLKPIGKTSKLKPKTSKLKLNGTCESIVDKCQVLQRASGLGPRG